MVTANPVAENELWGAIKRMGSAGETLHVSVAVKSNTRARQSQAPIYPISTTNNSNALLCVFGAVGQAYRPSISTRKDPSDNLIQYTTLIVQVEWQNQFIVISKYIQ